jgi:hypothetical protein
LGISGSALEPQASIQVWGTQSDRIHVARGGVQCAKGTCNATLLGSVLRPSPRPALSGWHCQYQAQAATAAAPEKICLLILVGS